MNALIRDDLSAANVKFFLETESLAGWLKRENVDVLAAADAPATAPPAGASALVVDDDRITSNDGSE